MNLKNITLATIAIFIFSSCGTPSPQKLQQMSTLDICKTKLFGQNMTLKYNKLSDAARVELIRRNVFTAEEWNLINNHAIKVGMSRNAVVCSLGNPLKVNYASYGDQVVFGYYDSLRDRRLVYFPSYSSNTKATAWN